MKNLIFILFFFIAYSSFGQSPGNDTTKYIWSKNQYGIRQPRMKSDTVQDIPRDTMYSKDGIARIGNRFFVGNSVYWREIYPSSSSVTYGVDSITYYNNLLCQWKSGISTCYTVIGGGGVDSVTLVGDQLCQWKGGISTCYTIDGNVLGTFVDSVVVTGNQLCQWITGVSTCYTINNTNNGIDSVTFVDNQLCWWKGGIPTCSTISFSAPGVDSVIFRDGIMCVWVENFATCYNLAFRDTVIYTYPLRVKRKEETGAAHDSVDVAGGLEGYVLTSHGSTNPVTWSPGVGAPALNDSTQWSVLDSLSTPAVLPNEGSKYLVGTAATGQFTGEENHIATRDSVAGTYSFQTASNGDLLYNAASGFVSELIAGTWVRIGRRPIHDGGDTYANAISIGPKDNYNFSFLQDNVVRAYIDASDKYLKLTGTTGIGLLSGTASQKLYWGDSFNSLYLDGASYMNHDAYSGRWRFRQTSTSTPQILFQEFGNSFLYNTAVGKISVADTSSIFEAYSPTKGMLIPRLTTAARLELCSNAMTGSVTNGGTGYTNGLQSNVALTGGSGTGARGNIQVSGGVVTGVTLTNGGKSYVPGDVLSSASIGAGSGFAYTVSSTGVKGMLVTDIELNSTFQYNGSEWQNLYNVTSGATTLQQAITASNALTKSDTINLATNNLTFTNGNVGIGEAPTDLFQVTSGGNVLMEASPSNFHSFINAINTTSAGIVVAQADEANGLIRTYMNAIGNNNVCEVGLYPIEGVIKLTTGISGSATPAGAIQIQDSSLATASNGDVFTLLDQTTGRGAWQPASVGGGGTVTTVTGTTPINSSGGTTPNITIDNAAADGTTKGAASFTAADFNSTTGNISIDYTNGQAASAVNKGFLTSADWSTFNGKGSGTVTNIATGLGLSGGPITTTGTLLIDTASASILSRQRAAATYRPIGAAATDSGYFWQRLGNVATAGSDFIGTTNSVSLRLRSGNVERMMFDSSNGRIGIGQTVPLCPIHINAASSVLNTRPILYIESNSSAGVDKGGTMGFGGYYNGTSLATYFAAIAGYKENATAGNFAGYMAFATRIDGGANTEKMRITSTGLVGIGVTPTSTLHVSGSFATAYVAKTGTYTATASDHTIDCTSGTFTVTLPTAVGIQGRIYIIKNSGAGTITMAGTSSQTFDGAASPTIAAGAVAQWQSNNANWIKIN